MSQRWLACAFALLFAAIVVARPATAAVPACSSLQNPVYFYVGTTQQNVMMLLGRQLRDNAPFPATLVFVTGGSCTIDAELWRLTSTPLATT